MARSEYDQGLAPPETRLEQMVLVLRPDADQQKALDELVAAQQDPASPEYQQWLTPETFGERFGLSQTDLDQVVNWLQASGFEVEPVAPSRRVVVFSGTAGQAAQAFHTEIHTYAVRGVQHHANATPPEIPVALAEVVQGVVSLHDFHTQPQHSRLRAEAQIKPDYSASDGSHYVAPGDFATIYDVKALYSNSTDGTGQSIAVIGRTNISLSDVQTFRSSMGLPANNPTIVLNGKDPGIVSSDEEAEAILDTEWAGAVAPKAAVKLVVSASTASTDGIVLSSQYIVNQNVAPVVTLSFGNCELAMGTSGTQFWNSLWQQAAAQGMTVLVASGDSGAAGCDDPSGSKALYGDSVNGLCSSPYSTCVGGTQFSDTANPGQYWTPTNGGSYTSALSYIPEAVWNQSASLSGGSGLWAGGGGASVVYSKPSWQAGKGVPADGKRDVPDVALNASVHDAYLIYMGGYFYLVGGTSASTPSFAGLMALAAQHTAARLGNVNPALYSFATRQAGGGAAVFHDVTTGNNSVPGATGYNATAGYDLASGLGSVDAALLVNNWSAATTQTPSFQLSATPTTVPVKAGATGTSTVHVTPAGGFNSAVALSASGLPSGVTAGFSPATIPAGSTSSTLTLTATSKAASGTFTFNVSATGGGVSQSLSLQTTVSGTCSYAINPTTAAAGAIAANYSVQITATSGCTWTTATTASWITVASGASGSGNGTVSYAVATNPATAARSGAITIAGLTLTVNQAAAPFAVSSTAATVPSGASTGTIAVTATSPTATWTAVSNASWIAITSGASGKGNQNVGYSIAANTGAGRTGTITVAGIVVTFSQGGAACSYSVSPTSANVAATAGTYTLQVTAGPACAWTAASNSSFLTIATGKSGTGPGSVSYSAAANTSGSRSGTLTVAGVTVNVSQAAPASTAPTFSLSPTSASVQAPAGTGVISVTSSVSTATWTVVSNTSWITVTSGSSGKGSQPVSYAFAANSSTSPRTGTLTIAGVTFTVNQAAHTCTYSVGNASTGTNKTGFTIAFPVTAPSGCGWTASSNASWLTIAAGASGSGSGTVTYQAAINTTGASRTAIAVVAGVTISITEGK